MTRPDQHDCPDCTAPVSRRSFLQAAGGAAVAGALWTPPQLFAAPTAKSAAETNVGQLFATLSDEQKKTIVMPFDHELRRRINANWHVTKPVLKDSFYTDEQRKLVEEIVRGITTEEGFPLIQKQMAADGGGLGGYSIAIFGAPGTEQCQWELTGRHLTLRADGNSVAKAAFGGPLVYGHGAEDPSKNLFFYQTKQVNEVFKALDAKQAEKALLKDAPNESDVDLQGAAGKFPGISVSELSADQKKLVEATLKVLLAPYRKEDVDEVFEVLQAGGGLDKLSLAFYQDEDLNDDKTWDIWRVEGPSFVWHFRGAPHVHAYINIGLVG